jgi:uncharacterized membrane protein YeaQ/YmgE (transglycosylase-associated protein family)
MGNNGPRRHLVRADRGIFANRRFVGESEMQPETLLIWLVVGAVAGWLASTLVRGGGMGLIGDIVVGVLGAFIGGWLLPRLGIHLGVGLVNVVISATIGAVVLLLILRLIRRV